MLVAYWLGGVLAVDILLLNVPEFAIFYYIDDGDIFGELIFYTFSNYRIAVA